MSENEAIEELKLIKHTRIFIPSDEVWEMAIQALEEIQQCRTIGTVEDMAFYKKCYDEESYEYCGEYGTDNCGCKDRMEHLEKKIAEFEAIGTIEEIKALKEKSVAKKPRFYAHNYYCIECGNLVGNNEFEWQRFLYCDKCGQKLDWQ